MYFIAFLGATFKKKKLEQKGTISFTSNINKVNKFKIKLVNTHIMDNC